MKHFFVLTLTFIITALFATVNQPWTFEVGTGYQEDQSKWRLQDKGDASTQLYAENYDAIRFWTQYARGYIIWRELYLSSSFRYGVLGHGSMEQKSLAQSLTDANPTFDYSTSGVSYLFNGRFGFQIDLTPMRYYKLIFAPVFTYIWGYERLDRQPTNTNYSQSGLVLQSSLDENMNFHWFGPGLGLEVYYNPGNPFTFSLGYSYYWVNTHHSIYNQLFIMNLDSNGQLVQERNDITQGKIKHGGNLCQSGFLKVEAEILKHFRMNVLATIDYFTSIVKPVKVINRTEIIAPIPSITEVERTRNFKSRWTTVSAILNLVVVF